ncbi:hypothetical protein EG487_08330 [Paenibacillus polymyxa]|nr:hypothetical protein EG487_08330 [Paenibacillus polymyxa]
MVRFSIKETLCSNYPFPIFPFGSVAPRAQDSQISSSGSKKRNKGKSFINFYLMIKENSRYREFPLIIMLIKLDFSKVHSG